MTPTISNHLRLLSVLGAVGVVYIHATTGRYDPAAGLLITQIQGYLSHSLFHSALSLFAFTSAYLICLRQSPILPRLAQLVGPYLLWSGLWLGLAMALGQAEPLHRLVFDPIPGQLWFLRDLIVMTTLVPLIRRLPSHVLAGLAASAGLWWLLWPIPTVIELRGPGQVISNQVLSAYLCGALAARIPPEALDRGLSKLPSAIPLSLAVFWIISPALPLPKTICMAAGALAALLAMRLVASIAAQPWVARIAPYGFVIYLAHHPLIALVNGALMAQAQGNIALHLTAYALVPPLLIAGLMALFAVLTRAAPRPMSLLSGGRLAPGRRHA